MTSEQPLVDMHFLQRIHQNDDIVTVYQSRDVRSYLILRFRASLWCVKFWIFAAMGSYVLRKSAARQPTNSTIIILIYSSTAKRPHMDHSERQSLGLSQ